jgi:hypothetical protein
LNDVLSGAVRAHFLRTEILKEPPVLPRLGIQIAQLDEIKRGREIEDVLTPIPPALPDLDSLTHSLEKVMEAHRVTGMLSTRSLASPPSPVIPDTTVLERIETVLGIKLPCLKQVKQRIRDAQEALEGYDVCPVCEGPLDVKHAKGGTYA